MSDQNTLEREDKTFLTKIVRYKYIILGMAGAIFYLAHLLLLKSVITQDYPFWKDIARDFALTCLVAIASAFVLENINRLEIMKVLRKDLGEQSRGLTQKIQNQTERLESDLRDQSAGAAREIKQQIERLDGIVSNLDQELRVSGIFQRVFRRSLRRQVTEAIEQRVYSQEFFRPRHEVKCYFSNINTKNNCVDVEIEYDTVIENVSVDKATYEWRLGLDREAISHLLPPDHTTGGHGEHLASKVITSLTVQKNAQPVKEIRVSESVIFDETAVEAYVLFKLSEKIEMDPQDRLFITFKYNTRRRLDSSEYFLTRNISEGMSLQAFVLDSQNRTLRLKQIRFDFLCDLSETPDLIKIYDGQNHRKAVISGVVLPSQGISLFWNFEK